MLFHSSKISGYWSKCVCLCSKRFYICAIQLIQGTMENVVKTVKDESDFIPFVIISTGRGQRKYKLRTTWAETTGGIVWLEKWYDLSSNVPKKIASLWGAPHFKMHHSFEELALDIIKLMPRVVSVEFHNHSGGHKYTEFTKIN